ncbi:hypothetical protein [Aeromonas sp. RU39B]|uniref:hypothetical protein n=1 Tax=Aeromonas sp. RU39B TaxID=1907416 RepID=UPI001177724A|nr:hypothetical protein [Aeromonas sp. RU39B]
MTKLETQEYHLKWVDDLLKRPILWAVGQEITKFSENTSKFRRNKFFSLSDTKNISEETHYWYNENNINAKSIAYLKSHFSQCNLVIGYELSYQTRAILSRAGIKYIDMWLHPIRFMDDNLYSFDSNSIDIRHKLFSFNLSDKQYFLSADRFKISNYRGWNKKENEYDAKLIDNSALFIGQTLTDKAVCQNGKMLNILDFKDNFKKACLEYAHVYYSRHPMLRGDDSSIVNYINSYDNASIIEIPSYYLLCSTKIKKVFSISSSVVTEAKFFDKETEYLFQPVVSIGTIEDKNAYSSVFGEFVSPHFWSEVLSNLYTPLSSEKIQFFNPGTKIRDMLGLYYNSHTFDRVDMLFKGGVHTKEESNKKKNNSENLLSPNKILFSKFTTAVESAEVISFDVFDTLIERPVSKPSAVFDLMSGHVSKITSGKIKDFKEARIHAKNHVLRKDEFEEITLSQRYDEIKKCFLSANKNRVPHMTTS